MFRWYNMWPGQASYFWAVIHTHPKWDYLYDDKEMYLD